MLLHTLGATRDIFRLFESHSLKICADISLPVDVCLMADCELSQLRTIYGNPLILAFARNWLARQPDSYRIVETASTDEAVDRVAQDPTGGAVGNSLVAAIHDLRVVARQIQDETSPARFSVLGRRPCPATGHDQTLLTVEGDEMGGDLVDLLRLLEERGIEILCVDGHELPTKGNQRLRSQIRIELKGHAADPPLSEAIKALEVSGKGVTILGSYPAVDSPPSGEDSHD